MASLSTAASKLHAAIKGHKLDQLNPLLADDCILHQGNSKPLKTSNHEDLEALADTWGRCELGSSQIIADAANADAHTSFALVHYKDVKLRGADGSVPQGPSTEVLAIWHAVWDAKTAAVKELVVLSCTPKSQTFDFDPSVFQRTAADGGDGDVSGALAASAAFCDLYDKADPAAVPAVLSEDFVEWRPVTGRHKSGIASVQKNLVDHGKFWKADWEAHHVAAPDASSAFLAWASSGRAAGAHASFDSTSPQQLYTGLCFMLLDGNGRVAKSVHLELLEAKTTPLRWAADRKVASAS